MQQHYLQGYPNTKAAVGNPKKRKTPIAESAALKDQPRDRSHIPSPPTTPPVVASPAKSKKLSVLAGVWQKFVAALVVAVTILGGLSLYPRFSVTVGDPLVKDALLSVPLEIAYDGLLPLSDVRAECDVNYAVAPPYVFEGGFVFAERDIAEWVTPGDKFAMGCYSRGRGVSVTMPTIIDGEMEIFISYRPVALPFHLTKSLLLATEVGADGRLHWIRIGGRDRTHPPLVPRKLRPRILTPESK